MIAEKKRKPPKPTTAEEIAARLGILVPPMVDIGRYPEWLLRAANAAVKKTFKQKYWMEIIKTTRDDIKATIEAAIEEGYSMRRIAKEIREKHGDAYSQARALNVARTECLVGDSVVTGAIITAAYARQFSGEIVEVVTDSGRKVAGTPNHPMLTLRGWVALGELKQTDYLIGHDGSVEPSRATRHEDVTAPPATISEIFDSLSAIAVPGRKRTRKPDFHGDGLDGYVDVLEPDGPLHFGEFAEIAERLVDGVLESSDASCVLLAASRNSFSKSVSPGVASRLCSRHRPPAGAEDDCSDMAWMDRESSRDFRQRFAALVGGEYLSIWKRLRARAIASGHECFSRVRDSPDCFGSLDSTVHSVWADSERLRYPSTRETVAVHADSRCLDVGGQKLIIPSGFTSERLDRSRLRGCSHRDAETQNRAGNRLLSNAVHSSHFCDALSGKIQLHRVARLTVIKRSDCHVFNLSTECGYFLVDGLYTGNTANAMNSGHQAAIEQVQEDSGVEMEKEWLSVLGSTTRDAHAEADGQRVPIDGLFTVWGEETPWPGHWSMSARNRCQCQCTVISSPVMKSVTKSRKHLTGRHDQSSHGRGGSGSSMDGGMMDVISDPSVAKLLTLPASSSGMTVAEHSGKVLDEFGSRIPESSLAEMGGKYGVDMPRLMGATIALHDVGKGLAYKCGDSAMQHYFTEPIMKEALVKAGFSEKEIKLAVSLTTHDIVGSAVKGMSGLETEALKAGTKFLSAEKAAAALAERAAGSGIETADFVKLQKAFYESDALSYDYLKKNIFKEDTSGQQQIKYAAYHEMMANAAGQKVAAPPEASATSTSGAKDALAKFVESSKYSAQDVADAYSPTGIADGKKMAVRGAVMDAVATGKVAAIQDAAVKVLEADSIANVKAKASHLAQIVKGGGDIEAAIANLSSLPLSDLQMVGKVDVMKNPYSGEAFYSPGDDQIGLGLGYKLGTPRHELGHSIDYRVRANSPELKQQIVADHARAVEEAGKLSANWQNDPSFSNKKLGHEWFEEKLGIGGRRDLDSASEHFAEEYRLMHREIYRDKHEGGGGQHLAKWRERHKAYAKIFDAYYTATLIGSAASEK